jgi:hypothetical protein
MISLENSTAMVANHCEGLGRAAIGGRDIKIEACLWLHKMLEVDCFCLFEDLSYQRKADMVIIGHIVFGKREMPRTSGGFDVEFEDLTIPVPILKAQHSIVAAAINGSGGDELAAFRSKLISGLGNLLALSEGDNSILPLQDWALPLLNEAAPFAYMLSFRRVEVSLARVCFTTRNESVRSLPSSCLLLFCLLFSECRRSTQTAATAMPRTYRQHFLLFSRHLRWRPAPARPCIS